MKRVPLCASWKTANTVNRTQEKLLLLSSEQGKFSVMLTRRKGGN